MNIAMIKQLYQAKQKLVECRKIFLEKKREYNDTKNNQYVYYLDKDKCSHCKALAKSSLCKQVRERKENMDKAEINLMKAQFEVDCFERVE